MNQTESVNSLVKPKPKFSVTRKDLIVTWFSGTGGGGQYRNKHMNCCRIKHPPTGVIATGQSHRERPANQREALANLAADLRFKAYCEKGLREIEEGISLEEKVEESMRPENIAVMVKDENGKWIPGNAKETS